MNTGAEQQPEMRSDWWTALVLVLPLAALAALIYRPWVPTPFPVLDFATFLEVFTSRESFWDRWTTLVEIYAAEGRTIPLSLALLAGQWSAFEWSQVGWQWSRFILMLALVLGALLLLRRFGTSWTGAWIGAALFVVAGAAAQAWTTPQVAEPLGVLFLFLASGAALGYRQARNQTIRALVVALALAAAVQVKEPFVSTVPFVMLTAAMRRSDGSWGPPRLDRPTWRVVGITAAVLLVFGLAPMLLSRRAAAVTAYAATYSLAGADLERLANSLRAVALPITRLPHFPANAVLLALALAALATSLRRPIEASNAAWPTALAVLLLGSGIAFYLPWPAFPGYYALPYLLGVSIVVGVSITTLEIRVRGWRRVGIVILAFSAIGLGAILARNGRMEDGARRISALMAARELSPPNMRMLMAVEDPSSSGGLGEAYRRWAAVHGETLPAAHDISCDSARALVEQPHDELIVQLPGRCGVAALDPARPHRRWDVPYDQRDWRTLRARVDTATLRVWSFTAGEPLTSSR